MTLDYFNAKGSNETEVPRGYSPNNINTFELDDILARAVESPNS